MTHYIRVEMADRFGELARVVSLISGRGFSIEKLMMGKGDKPNISLAKVSLEGDKDKIDVLVKQINRQVRVTEARILNEAEIENDSFFMQREVN